MKKLIYVLLAAITALGIVSCSKKEEEPQQWEYKVFQEYGSAVLEKFYSNSFFSTDLQEKIMNTLGKDGWELVTVYTKVETVHPNFGNDKYVTGLQPNTRTEAIVYIFKRPVKTDSKQVDKDRDAVDTVAAAVDTVAIISE